MKTYTVVIILGNVSDETRDMLRVKLQGCDVQLHETRGTVCWFTRTAKSYKFAEYFAKHQLRKLGWKTLF